MMHFFYDMIKNKKHVAILQQVIPLILTVVIFCILVLLLYGEIILLNAVTVVDISRQLRWSDILIGMTIYLKTSVDFAIFIGNLMHTFPGWKRRIAIEIGTAFGNAAGTLIILIIWNFFRGINWLLALMIVIASLVLFRLAEDGIEHARSGKISKDLIRFIEPFHMVLHFINRLFNPLLNLIIPNMKIAPDSSSSLNFLKLFKFSFTVPFILGLDDFAGYVPLFNIVNVFGFAIGVFAGHMILNIFLFLSPTKTIAIVKNVYISLLGTVAFILLALWGLYEAYKLFFIH